jgi:hypothetical protein
MEGHQTRLPRTQTITTFTSLPHALSGAFPTCSCPYLCSFLQPDTQHGPIMSYYDVDAILTDGEVQLPSPPTRLGISPS